LFPFLSFPFFLSSLFYFVLSTEKGNSYPTAYKSIFSFFSFFSFPFFLFRKLFKPILNQTKPNQTKLETLSLHTYIQIIRLSLSPKQDSNRANQNEQRLFSFFNTHSILPPFFIRFRFGFPFFSVFSVVLLLIESERKKNSKSLGLGVWCCCCCVCLFVVCGVGVIWMSDLVFAAGSRSMGSNGSSNGTSSPSTHPQTNGNVNIMNLALPPLLHCQREQLLEQQKVPFLLFVDQRREEKIAKMVASGKSLGDRKDD